MESILKQPTTDSLGSILSAYLIWIGFLVLAPVIVFGCSQCCKKHKELLLGENQQLKEENEKLEEKNQFLGVRFYRVVVLAHPHIIVISLA
ncbi:uncharacterized protein LOC103060748 isoform X2 [Python bivittatus]|uniref:Uncharacterized protein LOC103060748 isoform X2 n=1 Tax=Python bivittatus TaxID=176946 RepID=A0A9F5J3U2_PYTBI|nr:uncharacterized protein LOC103060748 isoform X2 [Python bivittatus]